MAKSAPKKSPGLTSDVFDVESQSGKGIGLGRFTARLSTNGRSVDVLALSAGDGLEMQATWVQRVSLVEHRGFPGVVAIDLEGANPWIAFGAPEGELLGAFIGRESPRLAEIEVLHVIMQVAAVLQFVHSQGLAHGHLSPASVCLIPSPGGLYEATVIQWQPLDDTVPLEEHVAGDLKALGQLFYQVLTGVLPPSAQAEDTEGLEGQTSGAFDDVLLDWIEEDRGLKGLGGPALEAMADASTFKDVSAFMDAMLPHFKDHLKTTIEETGKALDEDRLFMTEVDRQRTRLRELESRQAYLRDWLEERYDRIERCDQMLEEHISRLRGLESLQTEVALVLGQSTSSRESAIDDVLTSWSSNEPLDGFLDENSLDTSSTIGEQLVSATETEEHHPESEQQAPIGPESGLDAATGSGELGDRRIGLSVALTTVVLLIIFGAICAALFINWSSEGRGDAPADERPTPNSELGTLKRREETPRSSTYSSTRAKPQTQPSIKTQGLNQKTPSEGAAKTTPQPVASDANAIQAKGGKNESGSAVDREHGVTEPPETVSAQTPPPGMRLVKGGRLLLGLDPAQIKVLEARCTQAGPDLNDKCRLDASESSPAQQSVDVTSFYMDEFEVSQGEYDACVKLKKCTANKTRWKKLDYLPVSEVSYEMAQNFCASQGKTLPTQRQWMYAARGANDRRIYPWGDADPVVTKPYPANFGQAKSREDGPDGRDGQIYFGPVKSYSAAPSPFLIKNLSGNVREWILTDPKENAATVMGGSWRQRPTALRITRTEKVPVTTTTDDIGFRCVVSLEETRK